MNGTNAVTLPASRATRSRNLSLLVVATAVAIAALSTVEAVDFSSQATVEAPLTVDYALPHPGETPPASSPVSRRDDYGLRHLTPAGATVTSADSAAGQRCGRVLRPGWPAEDERPVPMASGPGWSWVS